VGVDRVVVQLVIDPEENEDEASHSHGQTSYIDDGIAFVSLDIPETHLEVIFKHSGSCL
jgi:hypothetical protein